MRSFAKFVLPGLLLPALLVAAPAHAMRCAALPAADLVSQSAFIGVVEVVEAKSGNPRGGKHVDGKIHFKALVREKLKGNQAEGSIIRFTTPSAYNSPAGASHGYMVEEKPFVLLTLDPNGNLEATRCMNWTVAAAQGEEAEKNIAAIRATLPPVPAKGAVQGGGGGK